MQYLKSEEDEGEGARGGGINQNSQDSCPRIPSFCHVFSLSCNISQ